MARPWQVLPFTKEQLIKDYVINGMLQREIAEKYSLTQKVIWIAMRNMGIKARPRNSWAHHNQLLHNNHQWKGSKASYFSLHQRLRRHKGLAKKCEICGKHNQNKKYQWANMTGKYDDFSDYKQMCISCHKKHDKIYLNFKKA